ncbi:MAG: EF-P lysine aminoacylase EpmA [Pseudomonadota bacterium]
MSSDLVRPRWKPSAVKSLIELRAKFLADTRAFFAQRGVLEVETPIISRSGIQDPNLASVNAQLSGLGACFLHTSPELHMKRLLASGSGDIFQVCKVFRDAELGHKHSVEFTMVEWYRLGFSLEQMMHETVQYCCERLSLNQPAIYISYSELFRKFQDLDPISISHEDLVGYVATIDSTIEAQRLSKMQLLDYLMSTKVEPELDPNTLTCVYDYPAEQAALAELDPADRRLAKRFEVFFGSIELANGYLELQDANEQRARFENEARQRVEGGLPAVPMDELFLAAMDHGLPVCSGVAVGLDRLLMVASGSDDIRDVLAFSLEGGDAK